MEYVINKEYDFKAVGPLGGTVTLTVKMDHTKAMKYGKYFMEQDCVGQEIAPDHEFKDMLDESEAMSFAHSFYENREVRSRRLSDFYDEAWDTVATGYNYYIWSEALIKDCTDYYKAHQQM